MSSIGVDAPKRRDITGRFISHFRGNPEPGIEKDNARPVNTCVVRVLVGPKVYAKWRATARAYYEVIEEITEYERRVRSGETNVQVFINTFCLGFLTRSWAERVTVIFVAKTDHAVCINHLLDGKHKVYGDAYKNYDKFTELALSGKLD